METKRLEWIDSLKGFGVFIVILGHLGVFLSLEKYIYSFHMPLFFFISGYLKRSSSDSVGNQFLKKFKSLLVPFLSWNILSNLYSLINGMPLADVLREFFIIDGEICWNAPIWFLLVLFITEIIIILSEKIKNNVLAKCVLIAVFLLIWFQIGHLPIMLKLNLVPLAMIFYCLGNIAKNIYANSKIEKSRIGLIFVLVFYATVHIIFCTLNDVRVVYTYGKFGNPFYFLISAVSGVAFYFVLFGNIKMFSKCKILSLLGRNSLIIMASQFWFFRFFDALSRKLFDYKILNNRNFVKAFLVTVITIALILAFVSIIKYFSSKNIYIRKMSESFGIR